MFPNAIYCTGADAPIDVVDDAVDQKHPLGTRMILEDGRVFVYARCGGAIARLDLGVKNNLPQGVAQRSIAAAVAIGEKSVTVTCASPDGASQDGNIVEDEFEGGYILFFVGSGSTQTPQMRRVVSNTAGTTSIVFTFDRALSVALTDSHKVEVIASPYRSVVISAGCTRSVAGVPMATTTAAGQFLWLQTWGSCWLSSQAGCGVAGNVGLTFRTDGSLSEMLSAVAGAVTNQYAGYVLAGTIANTQGAPFFMLQLCP